MRISRTISLLNSIFFHRTLTKTNISLNFTFSGFTLLENDQKRTFYVILWDYIGPLEIKTFAAKKFFFFKLQTDSSQSII